MSANTEWAAIVRKLESELAEARCTDPDHHAINAERSEARGLRKAWIKLDDQRQTLERELAEVTKQRDELIQQHRETKCKFCGMIPLTQKEHEWIKLHCHE